MAAGSTQRKWVVLGGLCLAGAALLIWRQDRGIDVPAYRLAQAPLVQSVVASGRVAARVRSRVGAEIAGTVRVRQVDEGDRVHAGDVLAELDAAPAAARLAEAQAALAQLSERDRPQAQAALRQAELDVAQAERESRRRAGLQAAGAFSREDLEQAEQARDAARARRLQARATAAALAPGAADEQLVRARLAQAQADLDRTVLRAPYAGVIVTQDAEPGDVVQPGQVLFQVARTGATEIILPVDEKNLARLALAQSASVIADAYPQAPFAARVTRIAPSVDTQRGTVDVRLEPIAAPDFLREDMTVSVTIETGRRDAAIVVPNDALAATRVDAAPALYVVRDGRAVRTPVELGLRGLAMTEIVSGASAGDIVLAQPDIDEGTAVRPQVRALPGAPVAGP